MMFVTYGLFVFVLFACDFSVVYYVLVVVAGWRYVLLVVRCLLIASLLLLVGCWLLFVVRWWLHVVVW